MKLAILTVFLVLAVVEGIKTPSKERRYGLLKVPETLSTAATGYDEFPLFNMVANDPHHVSYIAGNRLYYHLIPHQRIVLHQEDVRAMNGLPRHLLESIRPFFPFFVDY
ncbi:hypothetical protein CHUAL_013911 [Chamberlinius hualienensis]